MPTNYNSTLTVFDLEDGETYEPTVQLGQFHFMLFQNESPYRDQTVSVAALRVECIFSEFCTCNSPLRTRPYVCCSPESLVHVDRGHYWTERAASLSGKSHRELFNSNLSKAYNRLQRNARLQDTKF
ncbi:hypothetical protein BaRGS_00028922 [Batillaria attramentaria]|uniref:Uncharacterized protein n=1 Tax=Batillaria attramentaria TaxID=370345 RepID=A0ABD0JXR1_9CAEN